MNDDTFMASAHDVLLAYQSPGSCPDQFVGEVLVDRGGLTNPPSNSDYSDFATRIDITAWRRTERPVVILVLESPHVDEFIDAKGPAKGVTGENIRTLFKEACDLRKLPLEPGSYPLILVNAIQYQCSLGHPTACYRDKVFAEVWNHSGKNDFQWRINALCRQGDVIINACTTGKKTQKNWELVEGALNGIKSILARVEHPGNWARRRNTALKHGYSPSYGWKICSKRDMTET